MSAISKRFPGVVALDRRGLRRRRRRDRRAGRRERRRQVDADEDPRRDPSRRLGRRSRIDGVPVVMHGPADAARLGIGIIHQELEVIDTLDVAGNVFLGREPHRAGPLRLLDRRRMEADTERQLARIGAQISPRTIVAAAVHRAAAVRRDCPRAVDERAAARARRADGQPRRRARPNGCFAVLRDLRASGTAIVYISHRLREIEALADRAVVLRDGRNAGVLPRGEITRDRLVQLMVGPRRSEQRGAPRRPRRRPPPARRPAAAAARSRAHGALPGRRGVADRQPRRGARRRRA